MNVTYFIFWLFHIRNRPTFLILTPFYLPCAPSVDCAHLFANYENISGDYTNFFINYAHNSDDYVNTPND